MSSVQATESRRRAAPHQRTAEPAADDDHATIDLRSPLTRAAARFAARCHARQWRDSDDAPFIEHPLEVARLLRGAGCSDVVVAAGLLSARISDSRR
ncbi:MAG: HD domain-containing protein [Solirubrobacterales bacterium]|nr:HD domain-containing protein [Solirubrobacterales bacterium]